MILKKYLLFIEMASALGEMFASKHNLREINFRRGATSRLELNGWTRTLKLLANSMFMKKKFRKATSLAHLFIPLL